MRREGSPALALVPRSDPEPSPQAELVWHHARDAHDPVDQHDLLSIVLELLRVAHHDVATVAQALTIGRARVRDHPLDLLARRATVFVEQALVFMGVKPRSGSAPTPGG